MKRLTALAVAAVAAWLALAQPAQQNRRIILEWDNYPEPSTNTVILLRSTNRVDAPLPWPVVRVVTSDTNRVEIAVVPARAFFYVTASNLWGESDPSNVADTPSPPVSGVLQRVRLAP